MAKPIFYIAPQIDKEGWYLKAFQANTTIELVIYLDEAETISVDKLVINSNGFFEYNGNEVTPRLGGRYDLFIFPDSDSADNNETQKAIRMAQDTASEILIGDGGAIEKATQSITGIVKFEGTDDSGGSIIQNITNSRNTVNAVFETLKATQQEVDDVNPDKWITPFKAYNQILDNVIPVIENWVVGKNLYKTQLDVGFLKQDGLPFDGSTYPRLAAKSIYKSKNILDLPTVTGNINAIGIPADSKPVIVRADDTFFAVNKSGSNVIVYISTDGLNYSIDNTAFSLLNNISDDNFLAAYDGDNRIILLTNGEFSFYNIQEKTFETSVSVANLANPATCHFNTRLNKYVIFSNNGLDFHCVTITKTGTPLTQSSFTSTTGGINNDGALTNGNDGSGNIIYTTDGFYFLVFNKISDTVIYKINERFLNDAFNEDNNIYNMTTGGSPLLDGSVVGISTSLPLRGVAVIDSENFAVIDYASDLQTSILVSVDGVFSYKVINNSFPINGKSGIIPMNDGQYILVGDNGDGLAYTKNNFDTITTNHTDNTTSVGQIGSGSAIFCNESNKFIIMMKAGSDNQMRYVELNATKVSEYATIDMTYRSIGETAYYVFAGTPE